MKTHLSWLILVIIVAVGCKSAYELDSTEIHLKTPVSNYSVYLDPKYKWANEADNTFWDKPNHGQLTPAWIKVATGDSLADLLH